MSASDKKKLRKEQNAAAMTERQQAEQKKQKKQKAYTITFIIAMVLVVAVVLCSALATPINRMMINSTVAASVNDHKLTATELNYFYVDSITNLYSQFDDYGDYQDMYVSLYTGWTPSKPVGEQTHDTETGETWADYFAESAIESAEWTYGMYDAAMADPDFKLTEDQQKSIDSTISIMELYATYYGYSNADGYVRAIYGTSASLESYKEYYTVCSIASAYAADYINGLEYTGEEYRAYETDKMEEYGSYSWLSYYVNASSYLTGGTTTKDENGKESTTYSDEEKKAAVEAALADAELLVSSEIANAKDLNAAINALEINKDSKTPKSATEYTTELYANVSYYTPNEEAVEWITSSERAEGDMICIEYATEDADGKETINGYYVLFYIGSTDNADINVGSVRHLLVAYEKDKDGKVSDKAKDAAFTEASDLLAKYNDGEKTEEAFTALIKEHSDDTKDGLYENVTPDSGFVDEFTKWAIADHEVGDVEIIKTEYGCHIMYYVGCSDLNYRDTLIDSDMRSEDYEEWEEDLLADVTSEALNLKYIDRDYTLTASK